MSSGHRFRRAAWCAWAAAAVLMAGGAGGGEAQESPSLPVPQPLEREGANVWVERSGGTVGAAAITTLRIETRGAVIFQGDGGSSFGYQTKRRVQARNEAEARRMLAAMEAIRPVRIGDQLVLSVRGGGDGDGKPLSHRSVTDVRVQPPRAIQLVVVDTEWGPVEVRDVRAGVNVTSGGGPILCDRIGGGLTVRSAGGELMIGDIGGQVRAATGGGMVRLRRAGGETWLETGGGEIIVGETMGALHATTGAGNIEVGRAGGKVEARTQGGIIRVEHAEGEVVAESAGGTIVIGSARGVQCESAEGGVKLAGVTGQMRVVTTAGSIFAELQRGGLPLLNSLLSAARGDITIWIPSNLAVTVAAVAESRRSRIVSEFPEIRVDQTGRGDQFTARAHGSLNGGGPVLRVAAGDGVVYLRRR